MLSLKVLTERFCAPYVLGYASDIVSVYKVYMYYICIYVYIYIGLAVLNISERKQRASTAPRRSSNAYP